ncbi:MAG: hypothetical protein ISR99_02990, partial [Parcubacteria group bacterium]|nr:hypothetical protein [Parcubacteria group bacterium]
EGIPELLDMMLLVAELEELTGDASKPAEGVVIEAKLDPRKGISATLLIKDGTLKNGMCILAGDAISPVRIMEDFTGSKIATATFSSPIQVIGFNKTPPVGGKFEAFVSKKGAETACAALESEAPQSISTEDGDERLVIPIILKADVLGSIGAINHEIEKIKNERIIIRVVEEGVGNISEGDVKKAQTSENTLVIGFNVGVDNGAKELALRANIKVHTFDIIYKLAEWLETMIKDLTPEVETKESSAVATLLKVFGMTKGEQVIGGRVLSGTLSLGDTIVIKRGDKEIGEGTILNLQSGRANTKSVEAGNEFGAQIKSGTTLEERDQLESFKMVVS